MDKDAGFVDFWSRSLVLVLGLDLGFLSRISIARGVYGRVSLGVISICGCCLILGVLGILGN